jgi:hypothetical protein
MTPIALGLLTSSSRAEGEAIQGPPRDSGLLRFARDDGAPALRTACVIASLALSSAAALAKEIHVDCSRENQSVRVDADTDRLFVQLMWSEGVAEEFQNGDSYISGPDNRGRKVKVTYLVSVDNDVLSFGQDRICVDKEVKGCADQHLRDTLDLVTGVLKYEDGETVAMLKCAPAPPGRRF